MRTAGRWASSSSCRTGSMPASSSKLLVLTIDPAYFQLTGGIERWLYRLVRKHGGRQWHGWKFDFRHLYLKSGSMARYSDFALDIRRIVKRNDLPGYWLIVQRNVDGEQTLLFRPVPFAARVQRRGGG